MSDAKLQLSAEEMRLVTDPGVILTKNSVMAKVVELMAGLSEEYQKILVDVLNNPAAVPPKISRGENYLGFPWVMLDYPRNFSREDVFAIRTMFWWGHAFSITLHLKGGYKRETLTRIKARWAQLAAAGFHVSVSGDEWRHEHTPDNYREISDVNALETGEEFLKLSAAIELHRWGHAPEALTSMFKTLISVLFLPITVQPGGNAGRREGH
ncbi:hypothetical protein [Puia sp.]|uniref:hypothetical protein n=1 Tax=Puia sp. TaxID=2045100 RepID=UPI002F3E7D5A